MYVVEDHLDIVLDRLLLISLVTCIMDLKVLTFRVCEWAARRDLAY